MCQNDEKKDDCGGGCGGCPGEKFVVDVAAILLEEASVLATRIRRYSIVQGEIWRRVPDLARAVCSHHGGDTEAYNFASKRNAWPVSPSTHGGECKVYVDLRTGELGSLWHLMDRNEFHSASDADILHLVGNLETLDAAALVAKLEAEVEAHRAKGAVPTQDPSDMSPRAEPFRQFEPHRYILG
jgi:hypothetical protein